MSVTGKRGVGVPVILMHDGEGTIVTVECKNGDTYRGFLDETEDNMNCILRADAEPTVSRRCVVFRQAHKTLGGNGSARALLLRSGQAVLAARRRRRGSTHGGRRE